MTHLSGGLVVKFKVGEYTTQIHTIIVFYKKGNFQRDGRLKYYGSQKSKPNQTKIVVLNPNEPWASELSTNIFYDAQPQ